MGIYNLKCVGRSLKNYFTIFYFFYFASFTQHSENLSINLDVGWSKTLKTLKTFILFFSVSLFIGATQNKCALKIPDFKNDLSVHKTSFCKYENMFYPHSNTDYFSLNYFECVEPLLIVKEKAKEWVSAWYLFCTTQFSNYKGW